MRLTSFFLKRPVTTNLIMIMIFLIGGITLFNLKRATYPAVDFDILKITTTYPGASARDVEINVTEKIEEELESVDGIDKIKSISLENLSLIYVFVDTDADDIDQVKDDLRRAVDRVTELPPAVDEKPEVQELRSSNVPVIEVAVIGKAPELTLRKIARDLEEEIQEIPGVMSVEKVGYRKREIKILVDANKLEEEYVSFNEVIGSIRNRNIHASGGNLESYNAEKKIVTFSEFDDLTEVADVIVRSNFEGDHIKLKDIGVIEDSFEDYDVKPRTNRNTSINLLIRSHAKSDIIDISNSIKQLIKDFEQNLPEGATISIVSDYSYYTDSVLEIVRRNAVIGFFLVLLILILFVDRYSAFWVAAGIPLSLLGAIALFPLFDIDINFISLITMIIVIGIVVDDAIVIGENISRHRQESMPPFEAAIAGVRELVWPVTTTVLTTILAFVPMFFMIGITGKFIRQIPIIVILALGISLLEAITLLPSHIIHSPYRKVFVGSLMEFLRKNYEFFLNWVLKHRVKTLLALATIPIIAVLLYNFGMKFILFPYQDIDIFHVVAELDEGANIEMTTKKIKEIEDIITDTIPLKEIQNFTTRVGHHDMDVYGGSAGLHENWALITVFLKPAQERHRTSEIIMDELEKKITTVEGFKKLYLEQFYDGPPIGKPVTVTYVSDNDDLLYKFAQETYELLEKTPGIRSLDIDKKPGKEELRLKINYDEIARVGITVRDVTDTIRAAYDGVVASDLIRQGEEIDFRVQLKHDQRRNIDILLNLQIPNREGRLVKLASFAKLEPSEGLESIRHYNGKRSITITSDVNTKIITAVKANQLIRKTFAERVDRHPGLRLIFGGEEKATKESMVSFFWAFICAMIGIYFLLSILFESFFQPVLVMASIPIGLAGVIFFFFLHNIPVCFMGMIGSLGLIGVIVNDSLVMITHLNTKRRANKRILRQDIIESSKTRLRPVLLTTITTVAGLIPTIYGFWGYEPFLVPIVLALAGGLIVATMGTLLLIPTFYSLRYQEKE